MNQKIEQGGRLSFGISALLLFLVTSPFVWGNELTRNTIEGRVVDEDGQPILNVLVKAKPLKCVGMRRALELEARTDHEGRFRYANAIAGEEYLLELRGAGFAYETQSVIPGALPETTLVLRAEPTHQLSGRVFDFGGVEDVARAEVVLVGEYGVYKKTVISDDTGRYVINDVPRNIGQGVIYAKKEEERSEYRMLRRNTRTLDLTLDAPCRIVGVVTASTTGEPLSGCVVEAKPDFFSGFSVQTTTGEDGAYVLDNLPHGEYEMWVSHEVWFQPPNRGDSLEPPRIIALHGKSASSDIAMQKKATIRGRVIGPDMLPAPGALVSVKSAIGPGHRDTFDVATTDENGLFELRTGKLEALEYDTTAVVYAIAGELGTGSITLIDLKEGEVSNSIDSVIRLSGVMSISGHLRDPTGNPISGVHVSVVRQGWPHDITDDTGHFQLDTFPLPASSNESFNIFLQAPRPDSGGISAVLPLDEREPVPIPARSTPYFLHDTASIIAKHDDQVEVDLVLTPADQLRFTGRVANAAGAPIAQANLVLFAGSVPVDEWQRDMHMEMFCGMILSPRPHVAISRTVTDESGRYTICVIRETAKSYGISHLRTKADSSVFSLAVETLDGRSRLVQDIVVPAEDILTSLDFSLAEN